MNETKTLIETYRTFELRSADDGRVEVWRDGTHRFTQDNIDAAKHQIDCAMNGSFAGKGVFAVPTAESHADFWKRNTIRD